MPSRAVSPRPSLPHPITAIRPMMMAMTQMRQPQDVEQPSPRKSKIHPPIFSPHPRRLKIRRPMMTIAIIPTISMR